MGSILLISKGYGNLTSGSGAQLVYWAQTTQYNRDNGFNSDESELSMQVRDKAFYGDNAALAEYIIQNGKRAKVKEGKVSLLNSIDRYEIRKTLSHLLLLIPIDEDNLIGESNGVIEVVDYGLGIIIKHQ